MARAGPSAFGTRQLLGEGEKRRPKGLRTKNLADLATPIFTDREIEWFVELQEKHRRGASTNWAAMLNDWNCKLLQLRLNPLTAHLVANVHPKRMGQLAAFEKEAYQVLNEQNSELSGIAQLLNQPVDTQSSPHLTTFPSMTGIPDPEGSQALSHQISTANLFQHAVGNSAGYYGVPSTAGVTYPAGQVGPPILGSKRSSELGPPNRGGLGTAKRCRKCTNAEGRDVFMTGHKCPLTDKVK